MDRRHHILILIVLWTYFDGTHSQLTIEEVHELMKTFHDGCLKTFPIDETLIDEANLGRFADNRDLKCYINCIFEATRFMKKGKFNAQAVTKYIKVYAPAQFQDDWLRMVETCKDVIGEGDPCERAFVLSKCFTQSSEHFMIP